MLHNNVSNHYYKDASHRELY